MRQNTPFYMFNKDNMEHVTQFKQCHVKCLGSLFGKDDVILKFFEDSRLKFWPCEMLPNFKTTVTLFLGKKIYLWLKLILIYNTNILTNLGNPFLWPLNMIKLHTPSFTGFKQCINAYLSFSLKNNGSHEAFISRHCNTHVYCMVSKKTQTKI